MFNLITRATCKLCDDHYLISKTQKAFSCKNSYSFLQAIKKGLI